MATRVLDVEKVAELLNGASVALETVDDMIGESVEATSGALQEMQRSLTLLARDATKLSAELFGAIRLAQSNELIAGLRK